MQQQHRASPAVVFVGGVRLPQSKSLVTVHSFQLTLTTSPCANR